MNLLEIIQNNQGRYPGKEKMGAFHSPVPPEAIDILPTGELYIPYSFFVKRLNEVFDWWVLLPTGEIKENLVNETGKVRGSLCCEYGLFVEGFLVGAAWGEGEILSDRQSIGTALESARSSALTRICMKAGVGLEITDDEYASEWKKAHAVQIRDDRGRMAWIKRSNTVGSKEVGSREVGSKESAGSKEDKFAFLKAVGELKKQVGEKAYYAVLGKFGVDHANKLTERQQQVAFYKELKAIVDSLHEPLEAEL